MGRIRDEIESEADYQIDTRVNDGARVVDEMARLRANPSVRIYLSQRREDIARRKPYLVGYGGHVLMPVGTKDEALSIARRLASKADRGGFDE